jgi:hypothetical protein
MQFRTSIFQESDWKSPELGKPLKAMFLSSLLHFKAHTLPFSFRFQRRPQRFAHTSASWKIQTQHFALRSQRNSDASISNLSFQFIACSWPPVWPNTTDKKSLDVMSELREDHSVGPPRPIHRQVNSFWSYARTGTAKFDSALLCTKCGYSEFSPKWYKNRGNMAFSLGDTAIWNVAFNLHSHCTLKE